jgi:DNA excision repair protein ERCC-5
LNKQGDLNGFFDISGSGIVAPRKRQAYASKHLQQVVSDYQKKRKHGSKSPAASAQGENSQSEDDDNAPSKKKAKAGKSKTSAAPKRGTACGRGRGAKNGTSRKKVVSEDEAEFQGGGVDAVSGQGLAKQLRLRPKPAYKGAVVDPESMDEE